MTRSPLVVFASTVVRHRDAVLLVPEEKPDARGLWNLPGGAVERGEGPAGAARRELWEEAGIRGRLGGLLGVSCGPGWLRFLFTASSEESILVAGSDIRAVRWVPARELEAWERARFESPGFMAWALDALRAGRVEPLECLGGAP
jgi:ADP-ribose pyrophosphatase YjhB (NUDIX family)